MNNFDEIISSGELVLVDFYATWCGPCRTMHPILGAVKEKMGEKLRVFKLDVEKNEQASIYYNIQSVPTLLLFKNGEMVWRQSGAVPMDVLLNVIEQYV